MKSLTWKVDFAGEPSPPLNLRIESSDKTSTTLSWQAPSNDGGAKVTGYILEMCEDMNGRWTTVEREPFSALYHKITNVLKEGRDYEFRVRAVNEGGNSKPSESTSPLKIREQSKKPGQPRVEVVSDDDRVTLKWNKPDQGESPISNYKVESKSNKEYSWKVGVQ